MRAKLLIASTISWLIILTTFALASIITTALNLSPYSIFFQLLFVITAVIPLVALVLALVLLWQRHITALRRDEIITNDIPVPIETAKQITLSDYYALTELRYRRVATPVLPATPVISIDAVSGSATVADLLNEAHILLAGKTGSGKTTLAERLLAIAIEAGDSVAVIDPHNVAGKWYGISAIGAGRDYNAIDSALAALEYEMSKRYQSLATGSVELQPLTVIIDEIPAIATECVNWKKAAVRLVCEARKVGIRLIILSQSPLVEDILLTSAMRRNFSLVALDHATIRLLLRDTTDTEREKIIDAIAAQRWPAIAEIGGVIRLLDRSDITHTQPKSPPCVWQPALPQLTDSATPAKQTDKQELLRVLIRAGVKREQARKIISFDNNEWASARKQIEQEK